MHVYICMSVIMYAYLCMYVICQSNIPQLIHNSVFLEILEFWSFVFLKYLEIWNSRISINNGMLEIIEFHCGTYIHFMQVC